MASEIGQQADNIVNSSKLPESLVNSPRRFDWFAALWLIEVKAYPKIRRIGELGRPREEVIRLGQKPTVQFASQEIASIEQLNNQTIPWLMQYFFGVFGVNGPLPLHLTEYALEQKSYYKDPVFTRFLDIFHHRMLSLLYRTWRLAQPTKDFLDTSKEANFRSRLQQLIGFVSHQDSSFNSHTQGQGLDQTFAGLLASRTKNAHTLARIIEHFTGADVTIESNVPSWLTKDTSQFFMLGTSMSQLGVDTQLGARVLSAQSQINIKIGPLSKERYYALLPYHIVDDRVSSRQILSQIVNKIVGHSISSVIQLVVDFEYQSELGRFRLGCDSWLGRSATIRQGSVITL